MITVDSPVMEALAFDYVNFGILAVVSNLWTWIAVVTAAVSFWRIRATSGGDSSSPVKLGHCSAVFEEIGAESEHETARIDDCEPKSTATAAEEMVTATETEVWRPLMCNDGVTKGKLTVYYDGDGERDNGDGELTAVSDGGDGAVGEWWERWERVVRTRNGEDGWYRYVDLTVINGNVVRLWDDNGIRYGGGFSVQRKVCCGW